MFRIVLPVVCFVAFFGVLQSSDGAPATTRSATTRPATTQAAATQPATHSELMTAMIDFSRDVTALLKTATNEQTAKAAVPKLEAARERILQLRDVTEAIGPMNDPTRQQLMTQHGTDLQSATTGMAAEIERINKDPALKAILGQPIEDLSVFRTHAVRRE
jgi:hypothetical protein